MELPPQRAKTGPAGDPGLPPQPAKTGLEWGTRRSLQGQGGGLDLASSTHGRSKSPPCRKRRDKSGAPSRIKMRKGWASPLVFIACLQGQLTYGEPHCSAGDGQENFSRHTDHRSKPQIKSAIQVPIYVLGIDV